MLITTRRVVRIASLASFLYQVLFVRLDKGSDRAHCKTVGTSQDLAKPFEHSQDFIGKPEEESSSGEESVEIPRNNHDWRGIIMPGEESIKNPGKTPPMYISPR